MRIRSLAFSYMTALGLLAIGSAAIVWSQNWMRLSDIHEAGEIVEVLRPAIKFVESLALERGVYNQVLVSKATGAEESRRLVAERHAVTDALFAQALEKAEQLEPSLRGAIAEPIARAKQIILDARAEAAPLLAADAPPSPEAAGELVQHYVEAGGQIDHALADAERSLSKVDPSLGMMLEISRLSNDIREQAGLRSTRLSRFAGTQKPFAIPERVEVAEATGALRITWRRLQRIAAQIGGDRIAAGVARVRSEFFDKGEPIYAAMTNAARDGSTPPMDFLAWRKWTVARLTDSLAARDAPIEEASGRLMAMRDDAIRSSALGLATIGGLFLVLLAAGLIIERRVLRPIGTLTEALDAFSHADAGVALAREAGRLAARYLGRDDEIGSLARAVDRFRTYARDLETLNQRFDTVLANLPQGVSLFDPRDTLIVANRRYAELYGLDDVSSLIGLSLPEISAVRQTIAGCPVLGADDRVRDLLAQSNPEEIASCTAESAERQDPRAQRRTHARRRLARHPSRHHRASARRSATRLYGRSRRADGPRQSHPARARTRKRAGGNSARRRDRGHVPRPRPVQDRQRHARPWSRRRDAQAGGPAPARELAPERRDRAARRRRIRDSARLRRDQPLPGRGTHHRRDQPAL